MTYYPEDQAGLPDCPACGGDLMATDEYGVFACDDCGHVVDVNDRGDYA